MSILNPISLSCLNTKELCRTGLTLNSILRPLHTNDFINRHVNGIATVVDLIENIKKSPSEKENTEEIQLTDGEIDTLIPAIESNLKNSINMKAYFPAKGAAAEKLMELFERRDRKQLIYGSYTNQGDEVKLLLKDLFAPEFTEVREASGIAPLFDRLSELFDKLRFLLEARFAEDLLPSTVKEQRSLLRYRLESLLTYVDANIFDNIGGFEEVKTPVNEMITDIMAEYKARTTRKANQVN